jgi:hypothetical protein
LIPPSPADPFDIGGIIKRGTILRLFCFHGHERILSRVPGIERSIAAGAIFSRARYAAVDRGWGKLALSDDKKTRSKEAVPTSRSTGKKDPERAGSDRDVGHALRSVYAKTVSEDIPSELLDLLGKLS